MSCGYECSDWRWICACFCCAEYDGRDYGRQSVWNDGYMTNSILEHLTLKSDIFVDKLLILSILYDIIKNKYKNIIIDVFSGTSQSNIPEE